MLPIARMELTPVQIVVYQSFGTRPLQVPTRLNIAEPRHRTVNFLQSIQRTTRPICSAFYD